MGFLLGLMLGVAAFGGRPVLPPMLGTIPLRCLAAFDVSEYEYKACRWPSLRGELYAASACSGQDIRADNTNCSYTRHLEWEVKALRDLKAALDNGKTPE